MNQFIFRGDQKMRRQHVKSQQVRWDREAHAPVM
jgi:hypothetical protein